MSPRRLDRHHRQHRGVAGRSDRHRLGAGDSRRQLDQPVSPDPRFFGIAAEMGLAEAVAVEDDLIARRKAGMEGRLDHAGEIDAENHRKAPDDRRFSRQRESVLVVDGGVGDADGHVAVHQLGFVHLDEADVLSGVGLVGSNGFEWHGLRLLVRTESLGRRRMRISKSRPGVKPNDARRVVTPRERGGPAALPPAFGRATVDEDRGGAGCPALRRHDRA